MALAREEGRRSAEVVRFKSNGLVRDGRKGRKDVSTRWNACERERKGKENKAQINKRSSEGGELRRKERMRVNAHGARERLKRREEKTAVCYILPPLG